MNQLHCYLPDSSPLLGLGEKRSEKGIKCFGGPHLHSLDPLSPHEKLFSAQQITKNFQILQLLCHLSPNEKQTARSLLVTAAPHPRQLALHGHQSHCQQNPVRQRQNQQHAIQPIGAHPSRVSLRNTNARISSKRFNQLARVMI
jgi:hypothetical protein